MRHASNINPPNRFESVWREIEPEQTEDAEEFANSNLNRKIEYIPDESKSIVTKNNSPDLNFNYSLNPYRGCAHGCAYCYARPYHEFLGFNAGLDFETRIVYKPDAANLFRNFLGSGTWQPEPISFSGVTDCYQPAERQFQLTRKCLEVALECRQPLSIVTKNALVVRDLDILQPLADQNLVRVYVSLTTLDKTLAREMEPKTSTPAARLKAIGKLAEQNIPVGVMLAPIIPGLNDSEIPKLLQASNSAGASVAGYVLLRLPQSVLTVFEEWLFRVRPVQATKVMGLIRQTRQGNSNVAAFGQRMVGSGQVAEQISSMFKVFCSRFGFSKNFGPHNCSDFRRPESTSAQLRLF